ncbi:Rv1733c family protein [Streptomyces griseoluteus]|uniref:Rv1733c family protein n=1 Tax=Streptomyces griseoluteus TaxID=29306 RepID=UPI0037FC246B
MEVFRDPRRWLWRWRRNPLRRRADVVEGWVLVGAWLLTLLAGTVAGFMAARTVERDLAQERAATRPMVAYVVAHAPGPSGARGPTGERVWTEVRWTAPDGALRTGQVRVTPGAAAGAPVVIWTDDHGRLANRPATPTEATVRAAFIGTLAATAAAVVPFAAGRRLLARLERHRLSRWDTEWSRLGPQWGRMTG